MFVCARARPRPSNDWLYWGPRNCCVLVSRAKSPLGPRPLSLSLSRRLYPTIQQRQLANSSTRSLSFLNTGNGLWLRDTLHTTARSPPNLLATLNGSTWINGAKSKSKSGRQEMKRDRLQLCMASGQGRSLADYDDARRAAQCCWPGVGSVGHRRPPLALMYIRIRCRAHSSRPRHDCTHCILCQCTLGHQPARRSTRAIVYHLTRPTRCCAGNMNKTYCLLVSK